MIVSDSKLWAEIAEFLLRVQRHPKFKPETVEEVQSSLESIPAIRDAIRSIDDYEKYIEMIIMADENEDILNYTLKQLLDKEI